MKTIRRTEWRGDLFASDLGPFLDRLAAATSVRVARRVHYKLPQDAARVTVDLERSLFRVAGNTLRPLGDMGPRIEIKAGRSCDVQRTLARLNPDGALRLRLEDGVLRRITAGDVFF